MSFAGRRVCSEELASWPCGTRQSMLLDGLSSSRMLCKARSCAKLAWMIDAVLVAIGHVSGSHQLGRALHEAIIFTIIVTRQRCGGAM